MDMNGKTALITGANTGLGFEMARALAGRGARVIVSGRSEPKVQAAIDLSDVSAYGSK
ncbi:MAG: SDR family NAD(P)-dependent oxidoreductase [Sulfitobacter sp.]